MTTQTRLDVAQNEAEELHAVIRQYPPVLQVFEEYPPVYSVVSTAEVNEKHDARFMVLSLF